MKIKLLIIAIFVTSVFYSCCKTKEVKKTDSLNYQTFKIDKKYEVKKLNFVPNKNVKNIIFMIGDGMSLAHMYSAWTANGGKLNIDNCQYVGLQKTFCSDKLITDSGASITAMITGQKTIHHRLSVDVKGADLPVITDYAKNSGLSTGIVSVCRLYDATPAAFVTNIDDRNKSFDIALDYANTNLDFICGGGLGCFDTDRKDKKNVVKILSNKGYKTPKNIDELVAIKEGKVFAVLANKDLPIPKERGDYLSKASLKGIELLSKNKKGFFLMIEGSQIDDYGHFNDLNLLMQEMLDFDKCIGKVFEWAAKNKNTLVIVTADHETGGLTLVDGDLEKGEITCHFSSKHHTGVMVPVYAFGPGAENFTGIYDNTDLFKKMFKLLNLKK